MSTCSRIVIFRSAVSLFCAILIACNASPRFVRGEGGKEEPPPKRVQPSNDTVASTVTPAVRPSSGKVLLTLEGVASYYAHDFHGKLTSNGETFDMNGLTAAHRTFPFGTKIRVTNLANGKVVVVRVNDRGPFVDGRIIDLSMGAARAIDLIQTGTAKVRLEVVQWGDGK